MNTRKIVDLYHYHVALYSGLGCALAPRNDMTASAWEQLYRQHCRERRRAVLRLTVMFDLRRVRPYRSSPVNSPIARMA